MTAEKLNDNSTCARILREAGIILLVTVFCMLAAWILRTPRLPLIADHAAYEFEIDQPLVTASAALELYEEGATLFVDTRSLEQFEQARIPGAMHVRPDHFDDDLSVLLDFLYPEDPILLYGDRLQATAAVAGRFAERGYEDLTLLSGGFAAWREADGPVDEPRGALR